MVDPQRCHIIVDDKVISVEPRSMDVLTYLANKDREVVSQLELFEAIWPDTTFNSNTVQRCITQLRKALGDDARNPTYISTHAKRGYCLDVEPKFITKRVEKKRRLNPIFIAAMLLSIVIGTMIWRTGQQVYQGKLTPITSSSSYDFSPVYSFDGKNLAFIRQKDGQTHIYLQELGISSPRRLTKDSKDYQSISWDKENQRLYFIVRDSLGDWVGQQSIDSTESTIVYRQMSSGSLWRLFPANGGFYYMLVDIPINDKPITSIRFFDQTSKINQDILSHSDSFTPYRIALSPNGREMAIAGENQRNQVEFRTYNIRSKSLSEPFATLPLGFTELNWHPNGKTLLVHHLNELYSLNLKGQFNKLPYASYQRLFNPSYHPNGKSIVMTLTEHDVDLLSYDIANKTTNILIDSDGEDNSARFSPIDNSLAFISSRSGRQQVFLHDGEREVLVYENIENFPIYHSPIWSSDGKKLSFAVANTLYLYQVGSNTLHKIAMPESFTAVLDWYSDGQKLLTVIKELDISYFATYDLNTGEFNKMTTSGVDFSARLGERDELTYYKNDTLFWGERRFPLKDLPDINSDVIPYQDSLLFMSNHSIIRFDGSDYRVLVSKIPPKAFKLADIKGGEKILFISNPAQDANIVQME